jgi:outer membrane protein assembly factor BamE (lipoprotein component of BamABCDE complex)
MSRKITLRVLAVLATSALSTSCVETVQESGYNFRQKDLANDKLPGMARKEIYAYLGSPSAVSAVDEEKWYYISSVSASKSVFSPKLKSQETLEIVFNEDGTAKSWKVYRKDDAYDVDWSGDKTYTAGHSIGVMEQIVGNVGRFSSSPVPEDK